MWEIIKNNKIDFLYIHTYLWALYYIYNAWSQKWLKMTKGIVSADSMAVEGPLLYYHGYMLICVRMGLLFSVLKKWSFNVYYSIPFTPTCMLSMYSNIILSFNVNRPVLIMFQSGMGRNICNPWITTLPLVCFVNKGLTT